MPRTTRKIDHGRILAELHRCALRAPASMTKRERALVIAVYAEFLTPGAPRQSDLRECRAIHDRLAERNPVTNRREIPIAYARPGDRGRTPGDAP